MLNRLSTTLSCIHLFVFVISYLSIWSINNTLHYFLKTILHGIEDAKPFVNLPRGFHAQVVSKNNSQSIRMQKKGRKLLREVRQKIIKNTVVQTVAPAHKAACLEMHSSPVPKAR